MTALKKSDIAERDAICSRVRDARTKLDESVDAYNAAKDELWGNIQSALESYNETVTEANEWRHGIASEVDSYISDRSDKWQESDKGSAVSSWKDEFEGDCEEAELEEPETLGLDIECAADALEALPEDCGE